MKWVILWFIIRWALLQHSTAATVLLRFDCVVEGIEYGPAPPVGTPIHVSVFYETPNQGEITSDPATTYFSLSGMATVTFEERTYPIPYMSAFIGADPDTLGWQLNISLDGDLTPQDPNIRILHLFFRSNVKFFDDRTRLPESLSEWNLQATDFNLRFSTNVPLPLAHQAGGDRSRRSHLT